MRLNRFLLFCILSLLSLSAWAGEPSDASDLFFRHFDFREEKFKGELSLGLEGTQIQSPGSSLSGFGPRVGVDYDLGSGFSVNPGASLAVDGTTVIYSAVNGYLRYSIFGNLSTVHQVLTQDGKQVVAQSYVRADRLSAGIGVEQLF